MSASMVNFPLVSVALVPIAFAAIPWGGSPSVGALPEAGQLRVLSNERRVCSGWKSGDHRRMSITLRTQRVRTLKASP